MRTVLVFVALIVGGCGGGKGPQEQEKAPALPSVPSVVVSPLAGYPGASNGLPHLLASEMRSLRGNTKVQQLDFDERFSDKQIALSGEVLNVESGGSGASLTVKITFAAPDGNAAWPYALLGKLTQPEVDKVLSQVKRKQKVTVQGRWWIDHINDGKLN